MQKQRVVVTGMGVISPIGNDVSTFWDALISGRSGAGPITLFDPADFVTKFACEVKDFSIGDLLDPKEARRFQRFTQFGIAAAHQALTDAGLAGESSPVPKERIGVIIGSGIGGIELFEEQAKTYLERGPKRISPFFVPMMISDIVAGQVSICFGLGGPNFAVVSACSTAGHSIHVANRLIQSGEAEVILAGGTEGAITHLGVGGFNALKALSTRNDDPEKASRPFDRDRDGFVIGEGAGVLVLESLDSAKRRGAKIHAELLGVGASGDAFHITAPHSEGEGARRAMEAALKDSGVPREDIAYINAHGTSTDVGDPTEIKAIRSVFALHAEKLAVSSTKSMHGHTLGAAGAIEAIASILATQNNLIPPTINVENQDPECDLFVTPNKAVRRVVQVAMSNAFGFGGHNSSLIFAKPEYRR
ncbi:MAG: beta-ketoacyl-ACP synthase II [Calditrichaeota bacterium]|nr:beta-ketoacyl-ACP synthase II [Calditrichota bacterium]MCB9366490.1 beta-ketoacyl-ACP synthase II [Calditrichota bacterium]MCB9391252.1 beta-ketoacyl-ACP synthase II [Calditrichota bacterium]